MAEFIEKQKVLDAFTPQCGDWSEAWSADEIKQKIDNIPPADVRPVVRGKWIWNPDGMDWGLGAWRCNKCQTKAETWWATGKRYNPLRCSGGNFCGNCGADMREG